MKASDVSFFARHVEKIVLSLGVLVLLVICLLYVIGDPYAVDLKSAPGSKSLTPQEVEEYVIDEVEKLEAALTVKDKIEPPVIPNYHEEFNRAYVRLPLDDAQFALLGGPPLAEDFGGDSTDMPIFAMPDVPMPLNSLANANHGLMDVAAFVDPDTAASYRKLIRNAAPADFRSATVEATFDVGEWRRRFLSIPADKRPPDYFVRSRLLVTCVYLIRQTQDPISKHWGDETIVPVLPDQIAFLPNQDRAFTTPQAESAEQLIRSNIANVLRPEFPPLAENSHPWNPPSTKLNELTVEQQRELDRLNKRIKNLERQIRSAEGRPEPTNPAGQRRQPPQRPSEIDMGLMEGGYEEPSRTTRRTPRTTRENASDNRLQLMREELVRITRDRDMLQAGIDPKDPEAEQKLQQANQSRGIMYDPSMYEMMGSEMGPDGMYMDMVPPGQPGAPGRFQQPGAAEDDEQALPEGQIRIWAHDLTVEPGRTYRYKIVAGVMNPLFHRKRLNPEQVEEHMHKITLVPSANEIRKAAWTEPVSIDPEYYFFAVAGSPRDQVAKIQVFRIYNGVWRQAEFDVRPGDPIGGEIEVELPDGERRKVNMEVGAFMVDMISVPIPGNVVGSSRLLYLDPLTNRIAERDVNEDRNANELQRLRFEVQQGEARAQEAQAAATP